jgi:hypothetical protein
MSLRGHSKLNNTTPRAHAASGPEGSPDREWARRLSMMATGASPAGVESSQAPSFKFTTGGIPSQVRGRARGSGAASTRQPRRPRCGLGRERSSVAPRKLSHGSTTGPALGPRPWTHPRAPPTVTRTRGRALRLRQARRRPGHWQAKHAYCPADSESQDHGAIRQLAHQQPEATPEAASISSLNNAVRVTLEPSHWHARTALKMPLLPAGPRPGPGASGPRAHILP